MPGLLNPGILRLLYAKHGYICNEECITIPKQPIEGPDLKKENKVFYCTVTINNLEKARVKCRIHHWSTDPSERLPYVFEHWNLPAEPLMGVEQAGAGNDGNLKTEAENVKMKLLK